MIITKETIAHYLLGRGLLSFDSVVDGDFLVVEATSRNRNFKVIRSSNPGYFVKQVKTLMPKFYDSDPARHALVIELLPEGGSLSDYHRQLGSFPVEVGVQLGRILGTYQREMGRRLRDGAKSNAFARRVPWILSLHQLNQNLFGQLSAANTQVLNIIQSYPDFQQTLDRMSAGWRFDSLIHGDIKWDNLHVSVEGNGEVKTEGEMKLRLIDWELADFGDACWDAGAVFQS